MGLFDKLNKMKKTATSIADATDRFFDQANDLIKNAGSNESHSTNQVNVVNWADYWERNIYCKNCGAYLPPFAFTCLKCDAPNDTAVMLFPKKRKNNKRDLLEWQKIVVANSPDRLLYSQAQLIDCTTTFGARKLEIIEESQYQVNNTSNPEVYFSRYDEIYDELIRLLWIEPFYTFAKGSPSESITLLWDMEDSSNKAFIERYYYSVSEKAHALKTEKGKINRFHKFYDSLVPYFRRLSPENINYVEELYHTGLQKVENGEVLIDKRISNRQRIQKDLDKFKEWGQDLVVIHTHSGCPICSKFTGIIYSISGANKRYSKLPIEVIEQTHSCPLHSMSLGLYMEGISTPPSKTT